MSGPEIEPSDQDERFRAVVLARMRGAHRIVRVIAGELGSYNFPELREEAHRLRGRNVTVRVYANEPEADVAASLRGAGVDLHLGRLRSFHHYLVLDDTEVVTSLKERTGVRTPTGSRRAVDGVGDRELAKAVARYQDFLVASADRLSAGGKLSVGQVLDLLDGDLAVGRRIPLGENILEVAGMPEPEAREFVAELRSRVRDELTVSGRPPGPMTETTMVNELCLRTATLMSGSP
jgi:hypothetical protein